MVAAGRGLVLQAAAVLGAALVLVGLAGGLVRWSGPDAPTARATLAAPPVSGADVQWSERETTPEAQTVLALERATFLVVGAAGAALLMALATALVLLRGARVERAGPMMVHRAVGASVRGLRRAATAEVVLALGVAAMLAAGLAVLGVQMGGRLWGRVGPEATLLGGSMGAVVAIGCVAAPLAVLLAGLARASVPSRPPARLLGGPSRYEPLPLFELAQASGAVLLLGAATLLPTGVVDAQARAPDQVWLRVTAPEPIDSMALSEQLEQAADGPVRIGSAGIWAGLGTVDLAVTECGRCFLGGLPLPIMGDRVTWLWAGPGTLEALGATLVAGRAPEEADLGRRGSSDVPVAWVEERFAFANFEDGDAVGRRLQVGRGPQDWAEVAGIFRGGPRAIAVGAADQPRAWVALAPGPVPTRSLDVVVEQGSASALAEAALRAVPDAQVTSRPLADYLGEQTAPASVLRAWMLVTGLLSVAMTLTGLAAASRARMRRQWLEWAVRRAVGARRRRVLRDILFQQSIRTAGGILLGGWLLTTILAPLGRVTGVAPPGTGTILAVLALVAVSALAGAAPSAWRVAGLPPGRALREKP